MTSGATVSQQRIDELEKLAFHNVPVKTLMKYCSPFGCWPELEKPITKKEVRDCLKRGEEALIETPLALMLSFSDKPMDLDLLRQNHIKKIAYFAKHDPTERIGLDVGMPSMGCHVGYFIDDGNHRFAGSIVAGRETIACSISGSLDHIKELDLWHPNDAYVELDQLYRLQCEQRSTPGLD